MPEPQQVETISLIDIKNGVEDHEIPIEFDSYNFDAFISKMRHESCKLILENIKR